MSSKTLNEIFREVILANELAGDLAAALRFSDPDGVRSGKSGWSFGVAQFDTRNNERALACLAECGFSPAEIRGIVDQSVDVKPLAARLAAHAEVIERYDAGQLSYCLSQALNFAESRGIVLDAPGGILALADYVNQYGAPGDGSAAWYQALERPVTATDVLAFKLNHTKYGKEHPEDCRRRYRNLAAILEREGF